MSDLISKLSDLRSQYNCFDESERDAYGTLSEAIKVLSAQPEFTNEEIHFALKQLKVYFAIKIRDGKEGSIPIELLQCVEEIQKYFENVSSAQPEKMRGKWIKDEEASNQHVESIYVCSACNNMDAWGETEKNTFKFCPNCGADMRER